MGVTRGAPGEYVTEAADCRAVRLGEGTADEVAVGLALGWGVVVATAACGDALGTGRLGDGPGVVRPEMAGLWAGAVAGLVR